jgi:hypothetical protein
MLWVHLQIIIDTSSPRDPQSEKRAEFLEPMLIVMAIELRPSVGRSSDQKGLFFQMISSVV